MGDSCCAWLNIMNTTSDTTRCFDSLTELHHIVVINNPHRNQHKPCSCGTSLNLRARHRTIFQLSCDETFRLWIQTEIHTTSMTRLFTIRIHRYPASYMLPPPTTTVPTHQSQIQNSQDRVGGDRDGVGDKGHRPDHKGPYENY